MLIRKSILTLGVAGFAGLISISGCADNRTTVFVQKALGVPAGADCTVTSDLDGLQSGVMDLFLTESYGVAVNVGNQMQKLGDPKRLRAETSYIQLEGFEVNIEGLGGVSADQPSYSRAFTSIVPPASGTTPGYTPVILDLVPAGAITEPGSYLVHTIVYGTTLGGLGVETPEFVFPLRVCEGCLFTCTLEQRAPCGFNYGNDYAHSCAEYRGRFDCATECPDAAEAP